jgi:hypothetical protein
MIQIKDFKSVRKGHLLGFATIKKPDGMVIKSCAIFEKENSRWVNVLSQEYEKDGKKKYIEQVFYEDPKQQEAFKTSILKAFEDWNVRQNSVPF